MIANVRIKTLYFLWPEVRHKASLNIFVSYKKPYDDKKKKMGTYGSLVCI